MRGFRSRAGVAEVVAWVDGWDAPLPAEEVPLGAAAGRVLSEGIVAAADVPPFLRAAMDGWAVDGASTFGAGDADPLSLRVVGDSRPGAPPPPPLSPGEAVRIRTGAPVPLGADAVLPAELGEEADGRLEVRGEVPPGRHVGRVGEDVRRGTEVLSALRRLRPQDVGLLSLVGVAAVRAVRRPRVAILVTGEEILPAGSAARGTRVPDANGPLLDALVRRDGGEPLPLGL